VVGKPVCEYTEYQFTNLPILEDVVPIYEYRCHDCKRRVSIFWRSFSDIDTDSIACPRCGGNKLTRLVSRVRLVRSEESRLDDMADPSSFPDLDENDPKSLGRWMRKMQSEFGAEMGEGLGPEFDEVVGRLEAGEDPEEIEKSMPELMGEDGGDGFGGGLDDL
jgi:putative FmdB family regulatory protein